MSVSQAEVPDGEAARMRPGGGLLWLSQDNVSRRNVSRVCTGKPGGELIAAKERQSGSSAEQVGLFTTPRLASQTAGLASAIGNNFAGSAVPRPTAYSLGCPTSGGFTTVRRTGKHAANDIGALAESNERV